MSDERLTIKLRKPIQVGSEVLEELSFREPTFGDLEDIDIVIGEGGVRLEMRTILKLAARWSGQTLVSLRKLSLKDAAEVGKLVVDFILDSQATGETGSPS